ncbi:MAG: DUF2147 domain-containing protein [Sphingobium sp.]|nr:DUF2147 domain-containing protein [Sphingobium sp.]
MARRKFLTDHLAWAGALALLGSPATAAEKSFGIWKNPSGSVRVRAEPCGQRMCGVVVWANEKAIADARRGGTDPLVGAQLFRDFVLERPGRWRGKVFVPDIGKTFSGTVTVINDHTLKGEGCLLGRIACKSQSWTRFSE